MISRILLLGAVLVSSLALADDELPANRPNFSSNATVIPFGMTILETGATYQRKGNDLNFSGFEGNLRFGFSKDWEFDFIVPNYVTGATPRGWGDSGVTFVRQLPNCRGWNMDFAFGATLPSGQAQLTGGAINPNLYFSVDHDLSKDLNLTNTFYANWFKSEVGFSNAFMIAKDNGGGVGTFAELFTQFGSGISTTNTVHLGVTFAHTADQQADVHFGRNISAGSDTNWFVGFGFSKKLGK